MKTVWNGVDPFCGDDTINRVLRASLQNGRGAAMVVRASYEKARSDLASESWVRLSPGQI